MVAQHALDLRVLVRAVLPSIMAAELREPVTTQDPIPLVKSTHTMYVLSTTHWVHVELTKFNMEHTHLPTPRLLITLERTAVLEAINRALHLAAHTIPIPVAARLAKAVA